MPVFTLVTVTVAPEIVPPVCAWTIALERSIANTATHTHFWNRMAGLLYRVVSRSVLVVDDQTRQVRRAVPPHSDREHGGHRRRVHDNELEPSGCSLRLGVQRESELCRAHHLRWDGLALEMHDRPPHEVDAVDRNGSRRGTLRHDVRLKLLNGGLRCTRWIGDC